DASHLKLKTIEGNLILEKIKELNLALSIATEEKKNLAAHKALGSLATQVAHDIRSPLAALNVIEKDLACLPEEVRVILRGSINRIRDIANGLLEKNRELKSNTTAMTGSTNTLGVSTTEPSTVQLLSSLIDPLITEKRLQFRSRIGIEIDGNLDGSSYGLFANIQATEFKRVLSNLVNNSVEALGDKGKVNINLSKKSKLIEILVQDNGKGIPKDILSKLGSRGETHGKTGGSGLGLYHAKQSLESWRGALNINSTVEMGTTITITLPQVEPPEWFVSELKLMPNSNIVVLDDDSSIHQIWDGRFISLNIKEKSILVFHCSTPNQLKEWVASNKDKITNTIFLTDYELLGFKETGLNLIQELEIGSQSILVTSRFEEKQIMESCQKLKVRLIPKGLAGFVPIQVQASEIPDCILIDDDALIHLTWKSSAKAAGKQFVAFTKASDFFGQTAKFSKNTPIYVDVNLGNGISGEDVAKKICEHGFKNIFLATGYEPERYTHLSFLNGVVAKDPPW
ncbi:MAG: HAMP domain-containing histidine kinase, partial [Deltaproteobacteria bacterium]|nr:HAMP domain-containing histidine kinase [Deltaproteobacteria bacterium]